MNRNKVESGKLKPRTVAKCTSNRQIADVLKRLRKPLCMKYSADGVWFRANPVMADDGRLTAFAIVFKYYDKCVETGEAGYCYVRIKGIEFRHWPYYASEWSDCEGWECQSSLEEDGVTDEELSALIDEHVEVPAEIVVDQVEYQMKTVMTKSAMQECLDGSLEFNDCKLYRDKRRSCVYMLSEFDGAKARGLCPISAKEAVKILWGKVRLDCDGAC